MYFEIFISFLKVGFLTIGGGSAAIPWIQRECLERRKWIDSEELNDIVVIANMLPGPSMVEMAGCIGYKLKGKRGSVVASLAIALPLPIIFAVLYMTTISFLDPQLMISIAHYALPIIAAMMLSLSIKLFKGSYNSVGYIWYIFVIGATFILYSYFKVFPPLLFFSGLVINYSFLRFVKLWK